MTSRSLIFSSLVLSLAAASAATVSGGVELTDSKDPAVRRKKDYSGIVVWLQPVSGKIPALGSKQHTIIQKGKRFTPHISVITAGTTVDFPNLDPIFHNAFSNFAGQPFDTGLYPPGGTHKIRFAREGIVRIFCNIHSMMSAVIVVLNTPWLASTSADGRFQISNVPPGEYTVHIWHERTPEETLQKLEQKITINGKDVTLPLTRVSESGYLELPHRNKYGRDYPLEPSLTYSGLGK